MSLINDWFIDKVDPKEENKSDPVYAISGLEEEMKKYFGSSYGWIKSRIDRYNKELGDCSVCKNVRMYKSSGAWFWCECGAAKPMKNEDKQYPVVQVSGTVQINPGPYFAGILKPDGSILPPPSSSKVEQTATYPNNQTASVQQTGCAVWSSPTKEELEKGVCFTCHGCKTQNTSAYGLIPCRFCNEQTLEEFQDRYEKLRKVLPYNASGAMELDRIVNRIKELTIRELAKKESPKSEDFSGFENPCKKEEDKNMPYEEAMDSDEGEKDEDKGEYTEEHDVHCVDKEDDEYYLFYRDEENDCLEIQTPVDSDEPELIVWTGEVGKMKGVSLNVDNAERVIDVLSKFVRDNTKKHKAKQTPDKCVTEDFCTPPGAKVLPLSFPPSEVKWLNAAMDISVESMKKLEEMVGNYSATQNSNLVATNEYVKKLLEEQAVSNKLLSNILNRAVQDYEKDSDPKEVEENKGDSQQVPDAWLQLGEGYEEASDVVLQEVAKKFMDKWGMRLGFVPAGCSLVFPPK